MLNRKKIIIIECLHDYVLPFFWYSEFVFNTFALIRCFKHCSTTKKNWDGENIDLFWHKYSDQASQKSPYISLLNPFMSVMAKRNRRSSCSVVANPKFQFVSYFLSNFFRSPPKSAHRICRVGLKRFHMRHLWASKKEVTYNLGKCFMCWHKVSLSCAGHALNTEEWSDEYMKKINISIRASSPFFTHFLWTCHSERACWAAGDFYDCLHLYSNCDLLLTLPPHLTVNVETCRVARSSYAYCYLETHTHRKHTQWSIFISI